jgi:gp16 family phage-associated protein
MKRRAKVKTTDQVRADFNRIGKPVSTWASEHGFKPNLVYEVLKGRVLCKRGKSHQIAVLLGMKEGEIERATA